MTTRQTGRRAAPLLPLPSIFAFGFFALTLSACGLETAPPAADTNAPAPLAQTSAPQDADALFAPQAAITGAPAAAAPVRTLLLVELQPGEQRAPRAGGSGVVLLADPASIVGAAKNLAICHALFQTFDGAPDAASLATEPTEPTRSLYWLAHAPTPGDAGQDRCAARLEFYDYQRAQRIAAKLGLNGEGPFLVIERNDSYDDQRVAAFVDLSRTPLDEIPAAARYARDDLLQAGDAWSPPRFAPEAAATDLAGFLGASATPSFRPTLVRAARRGACPLTSLLDECAERG